MSGEVKQVIVVRRDLSMRKGKLAAQVAHASMKFLVENDTSERGDEITVKLTPQEAAWLRGPFTKIVVAADSEDELKDLVLKAKISDVQVHEIIDSGRTEFHNVPTLTCAAFGPDELDVIDEITGHLKPL